MIADWGAETYGERWAAAYDSWFAPSPGTDWGDDAARVLAELAGGGRALELGIGTGRVALRLAARGVDVCGIDASEAMVEVLRRKSGGDAIPVVVGDFADVGVSGRFDLIYVVFNTLFALSSQEEQRRCLRNVAAHLTDDGVLVVEGFTPELLARWSDRRQLRAARVDDDAVALAVSIHDPSAQKTEGVRVWLREDGTSLLPVQLRYTSPAELDLMAGLAGLELAERWAGWDRSSFGPASTNHVSVYRHARAGG